MRRRELCVLVMIFLCRSGVEGQDPRFQHLTTEDGLSDNAVTCVYEDRGGSIWVGTENGLNRFDGSSVQIIPGTAMHITAVTGDGDGTIWAATKDKGLLRVDPDLGSIDRFHQGDTTGTSLCCDLLTAIHDLNDTTLLLGAREHALLFFDKRTFTCTYWQDSLDLSPHRASPDPVHDQGWCHALLPLNDTLLWIGFLHNGQSLLVDRRSLRTSERLSIRRAGSESQTSAALFGDTLFSGGWQNDIDAVRSRSGFNRSIHAPGSFMRLPVADEVNVLLRWTDHELLAGTRGNGLFLIDIRSGGMRRLLHMRGDANSLADDRIRALYRDRQGTLWVGTANGLDRFVPRIWSMKRTDLFNDPRLDHPDLFFHRAEPLGEHGARIFSSGGFFLVEDEAQVRHVPVEYRGRELQPTFLGPLAGTRRLLGTEYGIVEWDEALGHISGVRAPRVEKGTTYPVGGMYQVRGLSFVDIHGHRVLLAAALGYGVHAIDPMTDDVLGVAMRLPAETTSAMALVNDVVQDREGHFLYATSGGIIPWAVTDPLVSAGFVGGSDRVILAPGEDVRQMLANDGQLWAITRSGTLLSILDTVVRRFVPPVHVRSGSLGATADGDGNLWITTDDGLLRFNPDDSSFLHVPVGDGSGVRKLSRAITTLADGRIAFCADNAVFTFDPEAYAVPPPIPVPYVRGATVAGSPVEFAQGRVELSYRASVIDINISALALGFAIAPVFEYRLEGVEHDWRETPAREAIRYAGIPVGRHRLLVRVRDPFGRTGPVHELLLISVRGPIWQQWWFYVIAVLTVSAGLYALYIFRLRQAMKLQAVRNRIASDLHDEVGSSLSSITIGAQLAASLSPEASEQVKMLLSRMGETSSASLRSISDIVWAIDPKNDEGEALVKRMRRIAQELLESNDVDVSFDIGPGVEELKLPMNARKEIVLIYKEAVHNASKYSGASFVLVSLHRRNGSLAVSVKDDGKGFDVALHPDGHGLGSMRRRADAIGAELTLTSAPGMGTLVGVEVDLTRIRD